MEQTQAIEKVSQILNRKQYKKIKAMDRLEMERYLAAIYISGHEEAVERMQNEHEKEPEQEEKEVISPVLKLIYDMYCGDIKGVGIATATVNKIQAHARAKGYLE